MFSQRRYRLAITLILLAFIGFFLHGETEAANHREAPITALDRPADITDWYAFRSYELGRTDRVVLILSTDPLLEPSNGPNYFPFDDDIPYKLIVDNDRDALDDIVFEVRFITEIRAPGVFTGFIGAGSGVPAPANQPDPPLPGGTLVVPPAIIALDGPGSEGLNLRQRYIFRILNGSGDILFETAFDESGNTLFAVPSNVGPRTMPDYENLAKQGIYELSNGVRVFAGTTDDAFYIDLGAAFDSLNFRGEIFDTGVAGVLSDAQDADDTRSFSCDDVAGYNVNSIAIEVPIAMLTEDGMLHPASDADAVIGTYGVTSRARTRTFNGPGEDPTFSSDLVKIQRMGNPLINELIIGTGSKDTFSMSDPADDADFAGFFLDPLLARALNAVFGINVPDAPRLDLLPLVVYIAPLCPGCAAEGEGPIADLLRLNTGIPSTLPGSQSRLGVLGGDFGGFPNGRRVFDDVTDISTRAVAGILAGGIFDDFPNNRLGDGVNANDVPYQAEFPFLAFAQSGRDSGHIDPTTTEGCLALVQQSDGSSSGCGIAGTGSTGSAAVAFLIPGLAMLYVFGRRLIRNSKKS